MSMCSIFCLSVRDWAMGGWATVVVSVVAILLDISSGFSLSVRDWAAAVVVSVVAMLFGISSGFGLSKGLFLTLSILRAVTGQRYHDRVQF
jgi:uncharacterized Tic20 family protein